MAKSLLQKLTPIFQQSYLNISLIEGKPRRQQKY